MNMRSYFEKQEQVCKLLDRGRLTVDERNWIQQSGVVHPHTCGNPDCRADLTATETGWRCDGCGYEQTGGMW
jgi:hypothetical protein